MGSDYSTIYGTLPHTPQRPGTLDVLGHPLLVVPSEVHLVLRDRLMTLTDDSGEKLSLVRVHMRLYIIRTTVEVIMGRLPTAPLCSPRPWI